MEKLEQMADAILDECRAKKKSALLLIVGDSEGEDNKEVICAIAGSKATIGSGLSGLISQDNDVRAIIGRAIALELLSKVEVLNVKQINKEEKL